MNMPDERMAHEEAAPDPFDSPLGRAIAEDTAEVAETTISAWAAIVDEERETPVSVEEAVRATARGGYTVGLGVGLSFAIAHPQLAERFLSGIAAMMEWDTPEGRAEVERTVERYRTALRGDA